MTLETGTPTRQMTESLAALEPLANTRRIFALPNADTDSHVLIDMAER